MNMTTLDFKSINDNLSKEVNITHNHDDVYATKSVATQSNDGFMSKDDKVKLGNLSFNNNLEDLISDSTTNTFTI